MDFQTLTNQRQNHAAWRLLSAAHAPMIASFLHGAFVVAGARAIPRPQLGLQLDDHLSRLHETADEILFPKSATAYLDDWASDERGWLRKFYPAGHEEAHYDLTPSSEMAIVWLDRLTPREFIGTEARFATALSLLQQIADGTQLDPRTRIAALKRRKAEIDGEIARVQSGRIDLMDAAAARERFLLADGIARDLVSDFRAVEQNFRTLDRRLREQIAAIDAGALVVPDLLGETDEGRSFRAFREQLMSTARQDALAELAHKMATLDSLCEFEPAARIQRNRDALMEAGEAAHQTLRRLSDQLRRNLDDQARLENRRIMHLMRDVEQRALALRGEIDDHAFMEIDETGPSLGLPMERPLFCPPFKAKITRHALEEDQSDFSIDALFSQEAVDPSRLSSNVRRALQTRKQVTLATLVEEYPIRHGLAELSAYINLATQGLHAAVDDERSEVISWIDESGCRREATLPLIIYTA